MGSSNVGSAAMTKMRRRRYCQLEANDGGAGSLFKGMTGWLGSKGKRASRDALRTLSPEDDPDTIHIFTIASGHMYERLQKIMILSLLRNTR